MASLSYFRRVRARRESSTEDESPHTRSVEDAKAEMHLALVIAWSCAEPSRVGEIALFPAGGPARILGRGESSTGEQRVGFYRQRPGSWQDTPGLGGAAISRRQLRLQAVGNTLTVENLGKAELVVNGRPTQRAELRAGNTLAIGRQLLLVCARRPVRIAALRSFPRQLAKGFCEPDAFGMVGESPLVWKVRDTAASVARAGGHVLVHGESGTGKEHVVRMVHGLSQRAERTVVTRSGSTMPANIIDAELFGNEEGYPSLGCKARRGLIAEADGSTLFIDEAGELDPDAQGRLVRVLETGEYYRLGAAAPLKSDLRFVCTTNRDPSLLRSELLARLGHRVFVPGLNERREDVLPIAAELVRRASRASPELEDRFGGDDNSLIGRFSLELAERLVRWEYTSHVHELESFVLSAMAFSRDGTLELSPSLAERLTLVRDPEEVGPDDIREALKRHGGNQSRAWRDLGLSSRYVLIRLMRKHGLAASRDS